MAIATRNGYHFEVDWEAGHTYPTAWFGLEVFPRRTNADGLLQMMRKATWATAVAVIGAVVVLVLARHHNGQFPQPLQALWSMAFFFGVLISGNIHQPNGIGIAAFLFLFFFLVTLLILLPLRRQK
jgi:F0F1-type ATP synthase membrane subunit a